MIKFAPLIEIENPSSYSDFAKLIISSFMMAPEAKAHVYHLSEEAEQFLPQFYNEPGLRAMYNEEARRLYVEMMNENKNSELN